MSDPRPCGGCERGAPFAGAFKGPDAQCSACWLWYLPGNQDNCRRMWAPIEVRKGDVSKVEPRPPEQRIVEGGPGTELKKLFASLGINPEGCGWGCGDKARLMDIWGVEGCRNNREVILNWLSESFHHISWTKVLSVAAMSIGTGLAFVINPLQPIGSIVDEAIRRAAK